MQAKVTDQFGQAMSNQAVDFTSTLGTLSQTSKLTDSNGLASIKLTNNALEVNAGSVNVSILTFTQTLAFEFVETQASGLNIKLEALDDQDNISLSFDKNEVITLQARITGPNNAPVAGQVVNFSANIGVFFPSSKLTDSTGLAQVSLSNDALVIGADTITATSQGLSASLNYEFLDDATNEIAPTLTTKIMLNGVAINRFNADQSVKITSTLIDANNLPIAGRIIAFSADIGSLDTNTALTNDQGVASVTLSSPLAVIGAGVATATDTDTESVASTAINRLNYAILAADDILVDSSIRIGYFDENNVFQPGKIKLSIDGSNISAGGTVGLTVDLVDSDDNPVSLPTPVTFNSNCVQNSNARIDESVLSIRGAVRATFEDINCAGVSGTDDVLVASVTANGITNTASVVIAISGEELGSIEFISAEPNSIVLKGAGGQGNQENSTLTFRVKSALGNDLAQQQVDFTLETTVGGISLSRPSGFTNSQGLITTQVLSGSVPTSVRVTAKAQLTRNEGTDAEETDTVQTQSDLLSINTGLADQRSFTIAATVLNPEADFSGASSQIRVWLADNFSNPVHDGTRVVFSAEGGSIEDDCLTVNGTCFVVWTSAEPRVPDHRITIIATSDGHETFFDTNGNNIFDDNDGNAIINKSVSAGFGRQDALASGFVDMSEAWRDDNENNEHDPEESKTWDDDGNEQFSDPDGSFNGPQCEGSKCAAEGQRSARLRKSMVLIMASSVPDYKLISTDEDGNEDKPHAYLDSSPQGDPLPAPVIEDIGVFDKGQTRDFRFSFSDSARQTLPVDSLVTVSLDLGGLTGETTYRVPNHNPQPSVAVKFLNFSVSNTLDTIPGEASLTITITTPESSVIANIVKTFSLL